MAAQDSNAHIKSLLDSSDNEESIVEKKEKVLEAYTRLFFDGSVLEAPLIQPTPLNVKSQKLVFNEIVITAIEALDMIRASSM